MRQMSFSLGVAFPTVVCSAENKSHGQREQLTVPEHSSHQAPKQKQTQYFHTHLSRQFTCTIKQSDHKVNYQPHSYPDITQKVCANKNPMKYPPPSTSLLKYQSGSRGLETQCELLLCSKASSLCRGLWCTSKRLLL